MKLFYTFFLFVIVLVGVFSLPSKGSTKAALKKKKCDITCTAEYEPVCAGDGKGNNRSFGSSCIVEVHNCEQGANLQIIHKGECPGGGGIRLS